MAKLTYSEQLAHPNWQARRAEILTASGFRCQCCGASGVSLHVHHRRYIRGRMAWEYGDADLQALCEDCHLEQHERRADLDALLARVPTLETAEAVDLLLGYTARATGATHAQATSDPTTFVIGQIADRLRSAPWEDLQVLLRRLGG